MDKKKILSVKIINFKKWISLGSGEGLGGSDYVDKVFLMNLGTLWCLLGYIYTHLVVFSLYLALIKKQNKTKIYIIYGYIFNFDKSG